MDRKLWLTEMVNWLETFRWQWFATLTFRPEVSKKRARMRLRQWANGLRAQLGTGEFGWFGVREYGRTDQNLHYHILIKGLRKWHGPERIAWIRRWWELGGESQIAIYLPGQGGVAYILKDLDPADAEALEIEMRRPPIPAARPESQKRGAIKNRKKRAAEYV